MSNYINVKQLAERLGVSESTIWNHVKIGTLPRPYKIGHLYRWDEAEIQNHIKSQMADAV